MTVLLRNTANAPLSLPVPFRGILPAGGAVVIAATLAQVLAALGGAAFRGGLELSEVDHTPTDAFYLGSLLDPLVPASQLASAILAAGSVAQPPRVSSLGLTGAAPASLVLLAAGHAAGLYRVNRSLNVGTLDATGTVALTTGWTNASGAQTSATAALVLAATGEIGLGATELVIFSTGLADITLAAAFATMAGAASVDLYGSVTPVG